MVKIAGQSGGSIRTIAAALYGSVSELGVEKLVEEGLRPKARDLLERQAINRLMAQLFATHRDIVGRVIAGEGGLSGWRSRNGERLAVAQGTLADLAVT